MARKQLIKGANASRVEERIARVPADLVGRGATIFGAIKAMEEGTAAGEEEASVPPLQTPGPRASRQRPSSQRRAVRPKPASSEPEKAESERAEPAKIEPEKAEPKRAEFEKRATSAPAPERPGPEPREFPESHGGKLRVSDFTASEREAIVRCCSDYRNQLPTYLLAVQKELKIIDSVIEKCRAAERKKP